MSDLDSKINEMLIGSFHIWKPLDQKDISKAPNRIQWFRPNNGDLWFFDIDHSAIRSLITTESKKAYKAGQQDAIDYADPRILVHFKEAVALESIQLLERLKNYAFKVTAEEVVFSGDVVKVADIDAELTKLREGL